jgi:Haem-binding domain
MRRSGEGRDARAWKFGALALAMFLLVAQAFRIDKANSPVKADVNPPAPVKEVMKRSCYRCHSNETVWPWYSNVAPASWLVAYDVHEGREDLNFSA